MIAFENNRWRGTFLFKFWYKISTRRLKNSLREVLWATITNWKQEVNLVNFQKLNQIFINQVRFFDYIIISEARKC